MCNLASIALPRFVREQGGSSGWEKKLVGSLDAAGRYFDFEKLAETTKVRACHAGGTVSPGARLVVLLRWCPHKLPAWWPSLCPA